MRTEKLVQRLFVQAITAYSRKGSVRQASREKRVIKPWWIKRRRRASGSEYKERVALRNGKPFREWQASGELPRSACSSSSSGYHGQLLICLLMSLAQLNSCLYNQLISWDAARWLASPTRPENNNGSRFYSDSFT